jgi:hypothetical protein
VVCSGYSLDVYPSAQASNVVSRELWVCGVLIWRVRTLWVLGSEVSHLRFNSTPITSFFSSRFEFFVVIMKDEAIVGRALAEVMPQTTKYWFQTPHLILLIPLLSSAVAGYDGNTPYCPFIKDVS